MRIRNPTQRLLRMGTVELLFCDDSVIYVEVIDIVE
jgi:hypothetical protein